MWQPEDLLLHLMSMTGDQFSLNIALRHSDIHNYKMKINIFSIYKHKTKSLERYWRKINLRYTVESGNIVCKKFTVYSYSPPSYLSKLKLFPYSCTVWQTLGLYSWTSIIYCILLDISFYMQSGPFLFRTISFFWNLLKHFKVYHTHKFLLDIFQDFFFSTKSTMWSIKL